MINRIGSYKLHRWNDGSRTLRLTLPGYVWKAPELHYGWMPFFIGHHGHDHTTFSYRKDRSDRE